MKIILTILILVLSLYLSAELNFYYKEQIAEVFTASWCNVCHDAFAGIEVVEGNYDKYDFSSVRYYTSLGGGEYYTEETDFMHELYEIGTVPTVYFNGDKEFNSGGEIIASGIPYLEEVKNNYFKPSDIKLRILSFDNQTGSTTVQITNITNLSISNLTLRAILIENNVTDVLTHITRDIWNESFELNAGETVNSNFNFEIADDWNSENLQTILYVQKRDLEVEQSANTYEKPDYKVKAALSYNQLQIGPSPEGNSYSFNPAGEQYFYLYNLGNSDEYDIDLSLQNLPPDWSIDVFYEQSSGETGSFDPEQTNLSLSMEQSDYTRFHITINNINSPDSISYFFDVNSSNLDSTFTIPFYFKTSDYVKLEEENISMPPEDFTVYPQPFIINEDENLTFQYSSQEQNNFEDVLQVYNIKGQLIKSFSNLSTRDGVISVNWNGRNQKNNTVSSGIYLYKLKNHNSLSGKILIIN